MKILPGLTTSKNHLGHIQTSSPMIAEMTAVILSAAKDLPTPSDYKATTTHVGGSCITASQIITV